MEGELGGVGVGEPGCACVGGVLVVGEEVVGVGCLPAVGGGAVCVSRDGGRVKGGRRGKAD